MPFHRVASKTGLSLDTAPKNPALQPGWQLLSGVQERCQGIRGMPGSSHVPVGIHGQSGDCCSHAGQTGSWECAAEPLLAQAPEHPHLDAPRTRPRAPELWKSCWELSSLEKLAELLGAERFCKTTAQGIGLNLYFFSCPRCPNNPIPAALRGAAGESS